MKEYKLHEFEIQGMDCVDCASNLQKAISRQKGVAKAEVSFETSKLLVKAEEGFNASTVIRAVKRLGYQAKEKIKGAQATLYIEGMDCQDEVEIIEKKLKSLSGINDYQINLMKESLSVAYEPSRLSMQDIIKAVAETGMKARLEKKEEERLRPWWAQKKILFLLACGVLTLVAFILHKLGLPEKTTAFFYLIAVAIGVYFPAKLGLIAARTFTLNIYTLLVVAVAGALGLALWEEAAVLVFVYSLGAILESYATDKARGSIRALMELVPKQALVKRNDAESLLPVEEVKVGEIIVIKPGEKIPLDGKVIAGSSTIDEAPITGESIPVDKKFGDEVFAGSINQRGSLDVKVTKLSTDTTLAKIIHSVEEAQARKSKYQRFGERFSKYYTPIMFSLAILVASIPPLFFGQPFSLWFYRALVLLVVSCSCGLALSVPVAVVAAIGNAARHGILIKGGAYLEAASGLKAIAFDKTGTLTIGKPKLCDVIVLNNLDKEKILKLSASIESRSEHPLAEAILREAKEKELSLFDVKDFEAIPGKGAKAKIDEQLYFIGSKKLFEERQISLDKAKEDLGRLQDEGKTTVLIGTDKEIMGVLAIADQLRPEAEEAINKLKKLGLNKIIMLTGDNIGTARAVAKQAGIDEYKANLLPEDKVEMVKELKKVYGKIAFVGDGVNDAPAMAEADVGIAMGACGTDVAIETGDLSLMSDDLLKLSHALRLSRRSVNNIKQNIFASLAIVIFLVPAALFGFVDLVPGLLINEISALIVIVNGLRLLK